MLELKRLNIYANDRRNPTILITYITKDNKTKTLKDFKMWLRDDVKEDYDIINYANQLYYQIKVFNKNPTEKDIYKAYQMLFSNKLWENYNLLHEIIFSESVITVAPQRNYIEFHKDYMKEFVYKETIEYTKKVNLFDKDDGLEKEKI